MKKLCALFFVIFLLFNFASAESPELALDYVSSLGFTISDIDEYTGAAKCYMMEDTGWQSVAFTTTDKAYNIIALEELDANFNPAKLRSLFYDLVQKFDWDVVFYWPNYDTSDKIAVSYGITTDLDKTSANYSNKSVFMDALDVHLFSVQPLSDQIAATNSAIEAYKDSIYENFGFKRDSVTAFMEDCFGMPLMASEFSTLSVNVCAEFVFGNDFAACRTGAASKNMLLYTYSTDENFKIAKDDELWSYFSSLKTYIAENKTSVIMDGTAAGADTMLVVIDIITSNGYDRAVYDLITDDCTIKSMN